ncbi:unnamed protein product [Auanema sp. JU1783]|nr:unnamed protein product [Auanema sp. JU1783]
MLCRSFIRKISGRSIPIKDILRTTDFSEKSPVTLNGWVVKSHKTGQFSFLHLNDGLSSEVVQVVVPKNVCSSVSMGSAIEVTGLWTKSSGNLQEAELSASSCVVLSNDKDPRYATLSPDNLRKKIHLRPKSSEFAALLRLRSRLFMETHKFFMDKNFYHIDTPIFTANDCEGAGETFTVSAGTRESSFFGKDDVFLSVSGQLHLEAMCNGISRVYSLNAGLRAEKQQSSAHLSEFRMLEVEQAFCDSLEEICDLVEGYIKHSAQTMVTNPAFKVDRDAISSFSSEDTVALVKSLLGDGNYPRITYKEAVDLLIKNKKPVDGNGLSKKNELYLVEYFRSPVFITHFPTNQKPFYMKRSADGLTTESFDLLCPLVGEVAGGSVRESSPEELKLRGVDISWYTELRHRGKPISSGFGVGFDRLLQVVLGVPNIKDTIAFPRWFKHCQC